MKKMFIFILPLLGICTSCNKMPSSPALAAATSVSSANSVVRSSAGIRPEDCYDSMDDLLGWFNALYEPGDEITIKYLPDTKQYCITGYSNVLKNKY